MKEVLQNINSICLHMCLRLFCYPTIPLEDDEIHDELNNL